MVQDRGKKIKVSNSGSNKGNNKFKKLSEEWLDEQSRYQSACSNTKIELLVKQLDELIHFLITSDLDYTMYGQYKLPVFDDSFKKILLRKDVVNDFMERGDGKNYQDDSIDKIISGMEGISFNENSKDYCSSDLDICFSNGSQSNTKKILSKEEFYKCIKFLKDHKYEAKHLNDLKYLLWQKKSVFYEYDKKLGHYNGSIKMKLKLADGKAPDFNSKSNMLSNVSYEKLEIGIYIYNLLKEGIIEPSKSLILSPPKLIKRQGSKTQFGGSYENIKKSLQTIHHIVPSIFTTMQNIGCKGFYTVLKLENPHYQIDVDDDSKYLTSISTDFGNFQFKRVCYGFKESLSVVQKVVKSIFDGEDVSVYYDYIIFSNDNVESHLKFIRDSLNKATYFGLKLSLRDSIFMLNYFENFGYFVSKKGIQPDEERISNLLNGGYLRTGLELQSFLGTLNIYKCHAPLSPRSLSLLYTSGGKATLGEDVNNSIEAIRKQLKKLSCLYPPNYDQPFVIFLNISINGVTSVLLQNSLPIEFYTHCFGKEKKEFLDYKLAIDGLNSVLEKFSSYIYSKNVLIVTDSTNPICLMTLRNISNVKISNKNFITSFNVTIKYLKNSKLSVLDHIKKGFFDVNRINLGSIEEVFPPLQKGSGSFFDVKNFKNFSSLQDKRESYIFYKQNKGSRRITYVPSVLRYTLLVKWHNSMKFGKHRYNGKAVSEFKSLFFWFDMNHEIHKTWKYCNKCILRRNPNLKLKKKPKKLPPSEPWNTLNVNFTTVDGIIDLLVAIDDFCKFVVIKQLDTIDNDTIISGMYSCIEDYQKPKCIITDRSTLFDNDKFQYMCDSLSIKHSPNTTYAEKFNCVLKVLKRLLEESSKKFPDIEVEKNIEILEVVHNHCHKNENDKTPVQFMMETFSDFNYKTHDDYGTEYQELWEFYAKQFSS